MKRFDSTDRHRRWFDEFHLIEERLVEFDASVPLPRRQTHLQFPLDFVVVLVDFVRRRFFTHQFDQTTSEVRVEFSEKHVRIAMNRRQRRVDDRLKFEQKSTRREKHGDFVDQLLTNERFQLMKKIENVLLNIGVLRFVNDQIVFQTLFERI